MLAHEPRHPVFPAADARLSKGLGDPRAAVALLVLIKDFHNALQQGRIGL
jgi:hypothetical protein